MLVDDETLPLLQLEKMLETNFRNIDILGTYTNPLEAEKMIYIHRPDLVFLDIEMPELSGLQLGERIQEVCPDTDIVFVTAFDQYAVQAFELYAIDYMMKPIRLKRLKATLGRLAQQQKIKAPASTEHVDRVLSCFSTISVQSAIGQDEVIKWRTGKARELFAYLLYHQGQVVYRDTILELLWPEFEASRAIKQLYTTVYHIRNTLKTYQLEEITINRVQLDNGYRLEVGNIQVDTMRWDELALATASNLIESTVSAAEQVLMMYKGNYLGEYDYLWAEAERERLRNLFLNHARKLHLFYMERDLLKQAIKVNEYVQRYMPLEEECYFNLMQIYAYQGHDLAVDDQYHLLENRLQEQLEVEPSEEVVTWYWKWKEKVTK